MVQPVQPQPCNHSTDGPDGFAIAVLSPVKSNGSSPRPTAEALQKLKKLRRDICLMGGFLLICLRSLCFGERGRVPHVTGRKGKTR